MVGLRVAQLLFFYIGAVAGQGLFNVGSSTGNETSSDPKVRKDLLQALSHYDQLHGGGSSAGNLGRKLTDEQVDIIIGEKSLFATYVEDFRDSYGEYDSFHGGKVINPKRYPELQQKFLEYFPKRDPSLRRIAHFFHNSYMDYVRGLVWGTKCLEGHLCHVHNSKTLSVFFIWASRDSEHPLNTTQAEAHFETVKHKIKSLFIENVGGVMPDQKHFDIAAVDEYMPAIFGKAWVDDGVDRHGVTAVQPDGYYQHFFFTNAFYFTWDPFQSDHKTYRCSFVVFF
ncbi:unnamed protein product, partial [Mesorhabditis spiculigera]